MSLDDLILSVQRAIDRLGRRLRRGPAPVRTHRRFLIVQIDGLSRAVLERGLAWGYMPCLNRLLRRCGYRLQPMSVGLPTSTPAFQMAVLYGVRPDIPGFHYYDRRRQMDIHFPRPGHAALVEAEQAVGRHGILRGGSAYGCIFTGGADNNLCSFASLMRPTGHGLLCTLSPFLVVGWVCAKSLLRTAIELARTLWRFVERPIVGRQSWRWLAIKIGLSVWIREFFTLAVCRDLYAGTPAVYVNYLDYDVAAHAFGPHSRPALLSLRRVDRAIRQLWRVMQRVPEHQYDLYILSDHGQVPCTPYRELSGGRRFERWIIDQFLAPTQASAAEAQPKGLARGIGARRRRARALFQHFLHDLDEDFLRHSDPEAYQQGGVRVIAAGPNAFLYVLEAAAPLSAEALARRFPGLAEKLSHCPGVGFVLARSDQGPLCFWRGTRYQLSPSELGPFAGRRDASVVVKGIADLMGMPSAGDLVIYGIDSPQGHVSFIPEMGAHAGPSPEELQTFIMSPAHATVPSPIDHPVELYAYFMRYQEPS
jgi:hypothetical protein